MQPVQDLTVEDRVSRTQYQYTLEDPDLNELNDWTAKLVAKLKQIPELRDVATDQQNGGLAAALVIDRVTASRMGITPSVVDETLYDGFGQRQVTTLYTQLNQYHVILETMPDFQKNPAKLQDIYVRSALASSSLTTGSTGSGSPPGGTVVTSSTASGNANSTPSPASTKSTPNNGSATPAAVSNTNGAAVPLSAFTHFESRTAPLSVNHQGQFPVVTVYIVLGVLYESYIHPITILSTLPSAGVGAILALLICGQELSVVALIGIILLIGIVKKNGIMMIDFALEAERKHGMSSEDAIYEACLLRFRPIMMTTMAALLGGLPLALGTGIGSELRKPLGIAMVGGLLLSQVLTLYTTPVIYIFFDDLAKKVATSRAGHGSTESVPAD